MNSERVINITSDKYHVTGTLEDYGVVIKLHFNFNGVSRTVGISRPLRESLAEKGLEMMEAAIEQLSDPGKVSLHYWYIDQHNEKLIAHGLVTGHPRVEDTTKIHTSPIQNISVDYDAEEVLVRTKNRVYHCQLVYCKFSKQDQIPDLLPDYKALKENYSNRIKNPEIEHGKVLLVLSDFDDCYFHSLCVKDDSGRMENYETYNHIGMFQDSFLIMGEHVDLRYFPHYKNIEFYSDILGGMPLYIENIGSSDLYLAIFPAFAMVFTRLEENKCELQIAALVLIPLIVFSRMVLGAHYLSDVSAGMLCGLGFVVLYEFLAARLKHWKHEV